MNPGFGGPLLPFIKHKMAEYTTRSAISTVSLSCIRNRMCIIFGRRIFLWKLAQSQSNASMEYSGLQSQVYWISRATFSKNNFSKLLGLVSLQHQQPSHLRHSIPCKKSETKNTCHHYSIHTPPFDLTCWKTSRSHLSFFLLKASSSKLIHNAFQPVGLSVFTALVYGIMFVGCWQPCVMFKQALFTDWVVLLKSMRSTREIRTAVVFVPQQ